jgi:hypothetical protein
MDGHRRAGDAAGKGGLHAAGHQHRKDVAPRGAAPERLHHAKAFAGADEVLEALVAAVVHGGVLL